jgi:hypothetical protein
MSFSAVVPAGGYTGWAFLKRTQDRQQALQQAQPQMQRDEAYFREKIGMVKTADGLVSDRRLLRLALGAFGLDSDLGNRFFIRKVLEEGTLARNSLANRLSNSAYREFSAAFGFGDGAVGNTAAGGFADRIIAAYEDRQFEIAVGEKSNTLRLALNAERELPALAAKPSSVDTKWYTIMGSAPLRQVFQTALSLPNSFASVDVDQQLSVFKTRSERLLGSSDISVLAEPTTLDRLLRRYLVLAGNDLGGSGASSVSPALQLLQAGRGGGSAAGILAALG